MSALDICRSIQHRRRRRLSWFIMFKNHWIVQIVKSCYRGQKNLVPGLRHGGDQFTVLYAFGGDQLAGDLMHLVGAAANDDHF